jgi:hypothetical protein
VSAALNQTPALQHANAVAADNSAQAVGNDYGRRPLFGLEKLVDAPLHNHFTFAVERAGRLVKQHNPRPSDQAAGDAEALSLTAA